MIKIPDWLTSSRSYTPFILAMLSSAGAGLFMGYIIFKQREITTDEMATLLAKQAQNNPRVLEPITSVYQYFIKGWRPAYFPGPHSGAPGFFATPFKPSLNGGVAHVLCKQGSEIFYLINLQTRFLDNGVREEVADLPAGFLNSGDPKELARTQHLIHMLGQERRKNPNMSFEEYQTCMVVHSKTHNAESVVSIDETLEACVRRECLEETGLVLEHPGKIFNIVSINRGANLAVHVFYQLECEDLPLLKPQVEEDISKCAWVKLSDIHISMSNSIGYSGYVLVDGVRYQIKPYDLIAEHIYKTLNDIKSSEDETFAPSAAYSNPRYETRVVR